MSVSIKGKLFARIYKKLYFLESILNFRVIAYNDAGPSEPGEASEPVVIDVPGVQVIIIILITIRVYQSLKDINAHHNKEIIQPGKNICDFENFCRLRPTLS